MFGCWTGIGIYTGGGIILSIGILGVGMCILG